MIQQEMLEYQSLDTELIRIEKELRKNEYFVKRKQFKALHQECEDAIAKLDGRAVDLRNQLAQARQITERLAEVIDEYSKELETVEDADELNYISKKLTAELDNLANAEKEAKRIAKDGEDVAKSFAELSAKLPKIVAGYQNACAEFDKAANVVRPRVNEIKKAQNELKPKIDANVFTTYAKVHEQIHPVFVPLLDDNRCGGCRMDMPSAVVSAGMEKNGYVRCEHCGRIIYKQ